MLQIAREMTRGEAADRQGRLGAATQQLQRQIVDDLDRLIEQARKKAGQCKPGKCQSQPSTRKQPPRQPPKPNSKPGKNPNNKPAAPGSPRPPGKNAAKQVRRSRRRNAGRDAAALVLVAAARSPADAAIARRGVLAEVRIADRRIFPTPVGRKAKAVDVSTLGWQFNCHPNRFGRIWKSVLQDFANWKLADESLDNHRRRSVVRRRRIARGGREELRKDRRRS